MVRANIFILHFTDRNQISSHLLTFEMCGTILVIVCMYNYIYTMHACIICASHSSVSGYNFVAEGSAWETMFVRLPC